MSDNTDFGPIVALLEARYVEAQKLADEKLSALNVVREAAGLPPRALGTEASAGEGTPILTQIKRDTFYGKKQMTAIREYLTMRRAQGDGPATPREIIDALTAGGYRFEAKSEDIALVGLRALLRKANNVFHKLPGTGSYGLLEWYPNAKVGRDDEAPAPKKSRGRPRKVTKRRKPKSAPVKMIEEPEPEPVTETAADE